MNINNLEQYGALRNEISMLECRIGKLRAKEGEYVADTVISAAEFPYNKHTVLIRGYDISGDSKIRELELRLKKRKAKLACELEKIERFIDGISDSEIRQIVQYRYIDGFSWQRIAFNIGKYDEQYPRKKYKKFIQKWEEKPKSQFNDELPAEA